MSQTFLSDDQWRRIEPLLPKRRSAGRPWADDRRVLEGILCAQTGAALARSFALMLTLGKHLLETLAPVGRR
ncbi:MAG: transposase [Prosthecobacter sp.]